MSQRAGKREVGLVVAAALAIATSAPLAKAAAPMPPLAIAAGRTLLAAAVLGLVAARATVASVRALAPSQRVTLVASGLVLAAHFAAFLTGLAHTSLPAAVSLVSLEPLSVVLFVWLFLGERPSRRELAGVGIATVGGLVVASGAGQGEHRLFGDALIVLAVALFGLYVVAARHLRAKLPLLPYAGLVYGVSGLALLPFGGLQVQAGPALGVREVALVVALALVPTLVGHTLLNAAARTAPAPLVALVSPGETLGSLVLGAVLLRAWPSGREAVGAALVIAGCLVTIPWAAPAEAAAPPEP
jgi:drug/metabolite transporter (DMT)-like permease